MAYKEIQPDPYEEKEFFKFNAIGDKFVGLYVSQKEGKYGMDFTFKNRKGEFVVTAKGGLKAHFDKAALKPGYLVRCTFTATKDIGKESPMRLFKVEVDDAPTVSAAAAAPAPKPAAPPPAADPFEDDDIGY